MILDYDSPATWPADVVHFLDESGAILDDWHGDQRFASPFGSRRQSIADAPANKPGR